MSTSTDGGFLKIDETSQCISIGEGDKTFLKYGKLSDTQLKQFKQHGLLLISGKDIFSTQTELDKFIDECIKITESEETMDGPWLYYNMQTKTSKKTGEKSDDENKDKELEESREEQSSQEKNDSRAKKKEKKKEKKKGGKILSRIECFCEHSSLLNEILINGKLCSIVGELFGENAVLYKEKINMKYPFDDGFAAHQDHAAGWWSHGHTIHISAFVAIDECTIENGCLQCTLNWGKDNTDLVSEKFKGVPKYVENAFKWYNALLKPGDTLFFTSFVPHRSFINKGSKPRRAFLGTWNKLSEGNKREEYYNDKEKSFPPDIKRNKNKEYGYKI